MRVNLLYNKIVADTVSSSFVESFNKILLPKLSLKFPDVKEAVIYEDYISDGLMLGGIFYCPLTLVRDGGLSRAFAFWRCDAKKFENQVPYSYIGKELLNIEISESAPKEIEAKIAGRVPFFAKNSIKLNIEAEAPTKTFLSGKYAQCFVDIMREKLTRALEAEFSITEASESSLEFSLRFAPETFMEHVLDNVSYRRILVSAKACAPRDLWIKWTRLDKNGTYTVSSQIEESDVSFEICEDVPEKIREREYRYLIRSEGHQAYKNAMSRKNFTEWRELVKRVIKRGEVKVIEVADIIPTDHFIAENTALELVNEPVVEYEKELVIDSAPEKEDVFDSEISLKLQSVLESYDMDTEVEKEPEEEINPDITELLRTLLSGNSDEEEKSLEDSETEEELPPFDLDELFESPVDDSGDAEEDVEDEVACVEEKNEVSGFDSLSDFNYDNSESESSFQKDEEIFALKEENETLIAKLSSLEAEKARLAELVANYEKATEDARREREMLIASLDAAKRREERERELLAEAAKIAVAERYETENAVNNEEDDAELQRIEEEKKRENERLEALRLEEARREEERLRTEKEREAQKSAPVRYVSKCADISFRHQVDPNITKRIQEIIVTTVKYFGKENVYMKIKATIPDPYMVRLEFLKIPENESALLTDIIRVLGHSKLGITKVLLD